jgi:Uma2 family endonuclease
MENPSTRVRLTYRDILALPDDLLRHELIDGEHIVSPAPSTRHQRAIGNLYLHLRLYLGRNPLGEVLFAPFDVLFSEHDMVEPDLIYMSNECRRRHLNDKRLVGPPDIAVEVLSPSSHTLDGKRKLGLYERFAVPEYWLVDPEARTVRVHRLQEGRLVPADRLADRPLTTPLLPDFVLPLARLFE